MKLFTGLKEAAFIERYSLSGESVGGTYKTGVFTAEQTTAVSVRKSAGPVQLARPSSHHLSAAEDKDGVRETESLEKLVCQTQQQSSKRQPSLRRQQTGLCSGDKRCGEAVLTVRVRRLHNAWASSTHLLKPLDADTRLAVPT